MKNIILEDKDYELLDKLIQTTKSIESLYKKMYELEIQGKKDTKEFKDTLSYLDIALEVENKIYNNLDEDKSVNYVGYISNKLSMKRSNIFESVMDMYYKDRVYLRILENIFDTSLSIKIKSNLVHEISELMSKVKIESSLNDELSLIKILSSLKEINDALEKDKINTFLFILGESIEDYIEFDVDFIKTKYNLIFMKKTIESDMKLIDFNFPKELNLKASYIALLNNIDINFIESNNYYENINDIQKQINKILKIKDIDYENKKYRVESILRTIYLRTLFLKMNSEEIYSIYASFEEFTKCNADNINHIADEISFNLIMKSFENSISDKSKAKIKTLNN